MLVPTWQTRTENLFKAMPPSASCIVFFFFLAMIFLQKIQNANTLWAQSLSYSCTRPKVRAIHACVSCLCTHTVWLGVGGGVLGVWDMENVRWGGLGVVFQSEWPAEENNKARMTGTDGPLYCPLKCKHWISLLGGWHYYIFIFSLLSLSLLIALVAGTHPHLRLKGLIKGWSQMLIIGCLRFNGQRHRTKMTRGGTTVLGVGWESATVRARKCSKSNSTTSWLRHLSKITPCLLPGALYLLSEK